MKQTACKLCGKSFVCDNGMWSTTCECAKDRPQELIKEAAHACRSALTQKEWGEEFEAFLGHIHEWATNHADVVSAAYVGISSEGLTGVIVTKGLEYQFAFDDKVTDLDIELAKMFPNCHADILQSPEGEPGSRIPFIVIEKAVQVYGGIA